MFSLGLPLQGCVCYRLGMVTLCLVVLFHICGPVLGHVLYVVAKFLLVSTAQDMVFKAHKVVRRKRVKCARDAAYGRGGTQAAGQHSLRGL